jgi:sn-glycerol 3-phosphate transport system permease protein
VYGWLLLLPAMALLALFTHYPAVANLWHSFLSTPKGERPAVYVGLDNYDQLIEDPIFWQALANNFWYALGTIPVSIVLALLMAVWVNDRIPGRGILRLAYFTPTVLPMTPSPTSGFSSTRPNTACWNTTGAFGLASHNWLGSKSTSPRRAHGCHDLKEAGFFMIFIWRRCNRCRRTWPTRPPWKARRAGTSSAASPCRC